MTPGMRLARVLCYCIFLVIPIISSSAWGTSERLFVPDDLRTWAVQGNGTIEAGPDRVTLKGKDLAALIPPKGVQVAGTVLGVNLSASTDSLITVYVRSNHGVFPERIHVRAGNGTQPVLYRFFIDEDEYGPDATLAAIEVRAANIDIAVHSVAVKPAQGVELAIALWEGFWRPDHINAATITTVATPDLKGVSFQVILLLIAALLIPVFLYVISRQHKDGALQKAFLFAFIAASLLFAFRMDYNWLVAWGDEAEKLSNKPTGERVRAVNNGYLNELLDQAEYMKRNLPEGAEVRLAGVEESSRLASLGRYYLLPIKSPADAGYIWTYRDRGFSLDASTKSLVKDGQVIAFPVRLLKDFGNGSAVYMKEARP